MRVSQYLLSTKKELPAEAEIISHQLMLRAGMIRKLASGLYTWLPLGLRVFRKVEKIVREEMDASGALELLMPLVQPADLWEESQRWGEFGPELLRINDRHEREFCLGPTHEEVITDIIRTELHSYRQLPINFYQIQTKFRDEVRPRFGVMRTREFCMKDAYSFHIDQKSLEETYDCMYQTYCRIFERTGLIFKAVIADTGAIGGSISHEFHVIADSGEDAIVFSDGSNYAANIEKATSIVPNSATLAQPDEIKEVPTPNAKTIDDVCSQLKIEPRQMVKTLIFHDQGDNEARGLHVFVVRGDHQLNEVKARSFLGARSNLIMASDAQLKDCVHCSAGSLGPVGLKMRVIVDHSAANLHSFVCGANRDGYHLKGVNWERDCPNIELADIRNVVSGDPSPDGDGQLIIKRGIEVGHIFQLGTKYSRSMNASVLDENGKEKTMHMGCYGIGIGRIVAAAIEQNHDERGIIWSDSIAPFQIAIIPINYHKSGAVKNAAENLYRQLRDSGKDVLLFDEVKSRLGSMLADSELIGIPHRIIIGERGLNNGIIEYQNRREPSKQEIKTDDAMSFLAEKLRCG